MTVRTDSNADSRPEPKTRRRLGLATIPIATKTSRSHKAIPAIRLSPFASISNNVMNVGEAFSVLGDVVRLKGLGVRAFCFRNPHHIKQIYLSQTHKSRLIFRRVKKVMGKGVFAHSGGPDWTERRRLISKAFPKNEDPSVKLQALEPCIDNLEARWSELARHDKEVELQVELNRLVADYSLRAFFSTTLGDQVPLAGDAFHYLFGNFLNLTPLWMPTAECRRFKQSAQTLRGLLREIIRIRKLNPMASSDVLTVLLAHWSDEEQIIDQMVSIFSGSCVLIGSLSWMFYLVAGAPEIEKELTNEIGEVLGRRPATLADLVKMQYSRMIFDETLRLYPSAWVTPRVCRTPLQVDHFRIPAKSLLFPVVYFLHRHPGYWQSPNTFNPDRFRRTYEASAFRPYGGGARMCPGASIAPLIAQYILVRVYQRFHLSVVPPRRPVEPVFGFELRMSESPLIRIKARDSRERETRNLVEASR